MRSRRLLALVVVLGLLVEPGQSAFAAVQPHGLFTDNMVLQQGMKVPVWGSADKDEKVTVRFQGQEVTATAKDGKWRVDLQNLKAGGPFEMTIAGSNTIQLKNVLVGEVWVCSGQSNMAMALQGCTDAEKAIADSKNSMIRLYTVNRNVAHEPQSNVKGTWQECGPDSVKTFSGVAYYFGRDLQKALNVPVGLIHSSWGGTPAEAWTSRGVLEGNPDLKVILDQHALAIKNYPAAVEKHKAGLKKHEEAVAKAKAEGKQPPAAPRAPENPETSPRSPAVLYNGMIVPLQPFAIRGAIWYQGESNASRAYQYRTLFPAMIKNWRIDWKQGDFPFLFVQLAPFQTIVKEPQESTWAELREAQLLTAQTLPNTAMAVITDAGDEKDIHPKKKEPAGVRLALAARAVAYGQNIVHSGPLYDKMKVEGGKAVLSFKHVGGGLVAKEGPLQGFAICGEDRKFVNAQAEIKGDQIVVSSPDVTKPVAVRYGWASCPVVNLFNREGLPGTPFRTDDFPLLTGPMKAAGAAPKSP